MTFKLYLYFCFVENKNIENEDKEKNGDLRISNTRIFHHNKRETNLTPLIEGNNTDLMD